MFSVLCVVNGEVKKFNRDKAEIVVRNPGNQIYHSTKSQGKRVVGESRKTVSIPENQTNAKHNRMTKQTIHQIKQTLGGGATK